MAGDLATAVFILGLVMMGLGLSVLVLILPGMRTIDRACVVIGLGVLCVMAAAASLGWLK